MNAGEVAHRCTGGVRGGGGGVEGVASGYTSRRQQLPAALRNHARRSEDPRARTRNKRRDEFDAETVAVLCKTVGNFTN